jgi:hypothetical protein
VLVLAHNLADLAPTLRGPPADPSCCALPGHQGLSYSPSRSYLLTCWPSERSARS